MTKEQVRRWLEKNPEFFQQYPELLLTAGSKGQVIPMELGELAFLRKERKHLHNQIQAMVDQVHRNDDIHRAFHAIQIRMITAPDLVSLIHHLTENLEETFQLKRVTVALAPSRMALNEGTASLSSHLYVVGGEILDDTFGQKYKAVIRIGLEGGHREWFYGPDNKQVRSEVLVPIGRPGLPGFTRVVGSLNLGAEKPSRFLPSHSTDLLQELADVLAICLNRWFPNQP